MAIKIKNKKPLRYGLYGESEVVASEIIHMERLVFRNPKHESNIAPHVHTNLFQVFFIYAGGVRFMFDKKDYDVKAASAVLIPENTTHGMRCDDHIDGMVLTFSSAFAENILASNSGFEAHMNDASILEITNPRILGQLKDIVNGLREELFENKPEKHVIHSYLYLILNKVHQLSLEAHEESVASDTRTYQIFKAFLKNVKQSYSVSKSVATYASELNITQVYLNRICMAAVGKSPLLVIHDFILAEAKKFLQYSNFSVSEISYKLSFVDPAYFSRFFKKMESVSPKEYRDSK
jgi:AraC family transcriptional activator of pobA